MAKWTKSHPGQLSHDLILNPTELSWEVSSVNFIIFFLISSLIFLIVSQVVFVPVKSTGYAETTPTRFNFRSILGKESRFNFESVINIL